MFRQCENFLCLHLENVLSKYLSLKIYEGKSLLYKNGKTLKKVTKAEQLTPNCDHQGHCFD